MSYDLKQIGEAVDQVIRNYRSPEVAAGELGISKSTLYNLRSGSIADPGIRVISRLAELLGKSIDEICGSSYYLELFENAEELKRKLERAEWIIDELREGRAQGELPRVGKTEPAVSGTHGEDYLSHANLTETTEQVLAKIVGSHDQIRDEMEQGAVE